MTPPTEGTGPNALEAAVLRIRDDEGGEPVGLGFLVSDELALACAHVVSAALGISEDAEPVASARLHVDLPLLPAGTEVTASVERWVVPLDVAVLRLTARPPGARPVRLVAEREVWQHPARVFGFPAGRPGGVWHSGVLRARQANGWVQADLAGEGYRVAKGFSGTPVWDEQLVGVVGMVAVAESGDPPVSYLIPTDQLLAAVPELRDLVLPPSPFPGLSAFQEANAAVFYGRAAESDELAGALAAERWVTVVGSSGSGKSSLAMAGVIPRLRAEGASAVVLRPAAGGSPLSALAAAMLPLLEPDLPEIERLARIGDLTDLLRRQGLPDVVPRLLERHGSSRLLVVVDQFEELLALAPETVDELAGVLFDDTLPHAVRVLTTVRADFLEAVLAHPRLGPVLSRRVHALGPLGPDRLREVVTAPVEAIPGVRYQPHLADRILTDTGTEPGALPLLGFTLEQLWRQQRDGLLTHQAYDELGGVAGALSAHADRIWADYVPAGDEAVARRLFTQLIRVPIGSAAATRRVAPRSELGTDEWRIAQRLAATRLLVIARNAEGTETVELAHEALITGWEKLVTWTAAASSFLVWRESLRHDMDRWERGERTGDLLPTAAALAAAEQWLREHGTDLSETERDYLERGRHYRRTQTRRRRLFLSGLGIVMVLALVFGTLAAYAQRQSRQRQALADSRALTQAAQDEATTDSARSVMLAMAAYRISPTQEARNQLLRQYLTYTTTARVLSGLLGTIAQFQTSRDGNVVFARSALGRAQLFVHAVTGTVRSERIPSVKVFDAMVSADGRRAAYVTADGTAGWFAVNPDAPRPIGPVHPLPNVAAPENFGDSALGFAMSADGRMMSVITTGNRLVWWDLDRGAIGGTLPVPANSNGRLWIGPGDRTLLAGVAGARGKGNGLVAIDKATGRTRSVVVPTEDTGSLLLSGDRTVAVECRLGDEGAVVSLRRVSDGTRFGQVYHSNSDSPGLRFPGFHDSIPTCNMAIDATGHRAVLKYGNTLRLVDLDRNTALSEIQGLKDMFTNSPDLVSAGGRLYFVGLSGPQIAYNPVPAEPDSLKVNRSMLTADGSKIVNISADGSRVQLRPVLNHQRLLAEAPRLKPYWDQTPARLTRSPDGRLFADREGVNVVSIREVATLRQIAQVTTAMPPTPDPAASLGFSYRFFDRGRLLTISGTQLQVWDVRTGRQTARFDAGVFHPKIDKSGAPLFTVAAYPAPNQVAVVVSGDPVIHVVDLRTGRTTTTLKVADDPLAIQFDPSGRYFGLLRAGSVNELWQRDPLRKELGPLRSLIEDPSGLYVATFLDDKGHFMLATDETIRIYQVGNRAYLDSYDLGHDSKLSGTFPTYNFSDAANGGKTLLYANVEGDGGALVLDPALWQRSLCGVIGHREFTAEERDSLPVRITADPICH